MRPVRGDVTVGDAPRQENADPAFRAIAEASPFGALVADADGNCSYANPALCALAGRPAAGLAGRGWLEAVALPDREGLLAGWKQARSSGEAARCRLRVIRPDGWTSVVTAHVTPALPWFDGCVLTLEDVTERETFERLVQDSEARFRNLFESIADAIVVAGPDRVIRMVNPAAEVMLGRRASELTGQSASILYADAAAFEHVGRMMRGWDRKSPLLLEAEFRRADGATFPGDTRICPFEDDFGNVVGYIGLVRDVTARRQVEDERKAWEAALRESEERYRGTFESLHDAFYETDLAGVFRAVSPSARALLGYAPEELVGTDSRPLYAVPAEQDRLMALLARGRVVNDFEVTLLHRDGSPVETSLNAKIVTDASGAPRAVQGTARDIRERKRAEAERDRIFRLSVDMIAVVNERGRFLRLNPAWERQMGYAEAELLGQSVWHFVHPADRSWTLERVSSTSRGEEVRDLNLRFCDRRGAYRWLSWTFTAITSEGLSYCVARDVTEEMKSRQQMEEMVEVLQANAAALAEQAAELDQLRVEAERLANCDMLTGVANRRAWFGQAVDSRPTAVAIFDIDRFKQVNDSYGHPAGDTVLCEVARRLSDALPDDAFLGRIGGEEFAVLFYGSFAEACAAGERCELAVASRPIDLAGALLINVTVSGGLARWRPGESSREQSLALTYEAADHALYEAKATGRQRLVVACDPSQAAA